VDQRDWRVTCISGDIMFWTRSTDEKRWLLLAVECSQLQIDWVGFNVPLNTLQVISGTGFLPVKWPNRQCQSTEGSSSPKDRLQSQQVHLTMLQTYTCMQYTIIHIIYTKTRNVGQCPTWWPPCRIQVAPSVQCRKVWLTPTTKLCNGAKMAIFCVPYFQRAAYSTFQTCILNAH